MAKFYIIENILKSLRHTYSKFKDQIQVWLSFTVTELKFQISNHPGDDDGDDAIKIYETISKKSDNFKVIIFKKYAKFSEKEMFFRKFCVRTKWMIPSDTA